MNRFLRLLFLSLTFVINAYAQTPDANGIVYVKTGGTGTGASWANASGNLSDALKAATTNTAIKQIWVSGGTWLPNYPADFSSADNRDKTFLLVKDVKLYGGFAGTETTLAERNLSLTANKTILSGDLGTVDDLNDNAYHVMIASGDVGTAEINGITIMKGTSTTGSSTNTLTVNGNGIMRIAGGGIILYGAAPAINNVIICGNQAIAGAGVYIGYNSSPKITNCIINGNYANISGSGNGGGLFAYQSTPLFTNVVIAGNNAAGWGGALAISSSTLTFNNSIIYGNGTSNPIYNLSGSYTAQYTMVQNVAANATNHNPASTDPYFVNAPSSSNAPFTEGDYSLTSSSPLIDLGSNSLYTGLSATSTDLVGKPRVANYSSGGIIDLGAIEYQPLTSQTITVADAVKTYGDADFEPVASSSSGLAVTLQSSDASIAQPYIDAADGNKWKIKILKAGVATITVSQSGNSVYAAATNETFTVTINKAPLTITASDLTKTYDGISFSGGNDVTYSGFVNGDNASTALTGTLVYNGTSQGATAVNSYTIIPSGLTATNYDITYASGTLTINKAALTITASDLTKTYDGISFSGGNGVTYSGFVNGEDASTAITGTIAYAGTSQGATTVNSYTIIPSGLTASNYDITYASGTLTINKAALTITASDLTKIYDGISFSGGNGVTYSGFVNGENASTTITGTIAYTGTSQGAIAVNSYTIIPSGLTASNYDITYASGTLTINKAALTITASDLTKTYDGISFSGGNGVTYSGFVNGEDASTAITGTIAYTGTSQGAIAVNSYTIIPSGLIATNYDITYASGTLTINKAALTITASDLTKTYDGISFSGGNGVTYSGFVNGEDASTAITGTIAYTGTSQGAIAVNSYTIIPSGLIATNYDITYASGTLTINKAALTITASDLTKTYDGISFSGGNGVTYSGFVNGEDASAALTGTITYAGTSQGATVVNSYTIIPSGLSATNYDITYASGTLTINKAALTITASDLTKTYDGISFSGGNGVTYSGFVNGEDASTTLTGTLTYTGTSQGATTVNSYTIIPSGLIATNYDITYTAGTLTINKAALTITASDLTKTYDGIPFSGGNGVTYNGFVNGEDASAALTGTLTYTGTSQGATTVNSYTIIPSGLTATNYDITYATGTLTINKAALTITADNKARCFGANDPSFTFTYNGWVNGESITELAAQPVATTIATAATTAGNYDIIPSGAAASNYTITYVNGTLTIYALPAATLSATEGAVLCGNNATITLTASGNYTYQWLLDNGQINGGETGTLSLTTTGVYTAVATDGNGCTANATNSITVSRILPPTASFTFNTYCENTAVTFTNTSDIHTSGVVDYTWSNGDGQTDNNTDAHFTYTTPGDFTVSLTATPQECPLLAATSTQIINIASQLAATRLTTINTTSGLPTQLSARNLSDAVYTWTPSTGLSDVTIYNPIATIQSSQEYQIQMVFPSGCITTDTLLVNPTIRYDIIAANAFTPNGDGTNDVFRVNLRGVKEFKFLRIYDRWGNKIYQTNDPAKGWDGRYGGVLQQVGTYIWNAEAIDTNGQIIQRQGVVTLLH
ncbi:MBG domain-containing protein [Chitinophaga sp. LS1]|uniref:MBG domain-containing protein n=1 Tax=Chitinophaga sp. LS1 TaxID=3051176 RepID=UPI002AABC024|nr:MBG domain-containing protein [Chitinophaga sp. LS1]WPV66137.1 MBG domain-containing protein [Chitinophaga sp. LS1]